VGVDVGVEDVGVEKEGELTDADRLGDVARGLAAFGVHAVSATSRTVAATGKDLRARALGATSARYQSSLKCLSRFP
jgi:hypothetical protein